MPDPSLKNITKGLPARLPMSVCGRALYKVSLASLADLGLTVRWNMEQACQVFHQASRRVAELAGGGTFFEHFEGSPFYSGLRVDGAIPKFGGLYGPLYQRPRLGCQCHFSPLNPL